MYFTSGSDRAFEQLMQGKRTHSVCAEPCGRCAMRLFHRKKRSDQTGL